MFAFWMLILLSYFHVQTTSECVMKRHIELKHETKKATTSKRRTCDVCSKKFNKEHTFKTHMETIHGGNLNNLNLNNNHNSQNREELCRATPVKRRSAKSAATSDQDPQDRN